MFDDDELVPGGDWSVVLELVDVRRWGRRAQTYALVQRLSADAPELGAYLGQRDVEAAIGTSRHYAYRLLKTLQDERVLVMMSPGAGRRRARWRINPNVFAWRAVPWVRSVTPEHVLWRVQEAGWSSHARRRQLVTRSYNASQRDLVTRAYNASQSRPEGPKEGGSGGFVTRYGNASQAGACDASWERVTRSGDGAPYTSSLESSSNSLSLGTEREGAAAADVEAVIDEIRAATHCDVVGQLRDAVRRLVEEVGDVERIRAAARAIDPAGMRAVLFVQALRRRLIEGPAAAEPERPRPRDITGVADSLSPAPWLVDDPAGVEGVARGLEAARERLRGGRD